jgi:hypothetical protein
LTYSASTRIPDRQLTIGIDSSEDASAAILALMPKFHLGGELVYAAGFVLFITS